MDINYFDFYSILQIDEITIKIILQSDVEDLPSLNLMSSKLFTNHLRNPYILNKLQTKWNLEGYSIDNLTDLIYFYRNEINAPPIFNVSGFFGGQLQLLEPLRWNKKQNWLNKVYAIQKSKLIEVRTEYTRVKYYNHETKEMLWTSDIIVRIQYDYCIPTEYLYVTVNKLYHQLKHLHN